MDKITPQTTSTPLGGLSSAASALQLADALCERDLGHVLSEFSGSAGKTFQPAWLDFCVKNADAARKKCFEIRKKNPVAGIVAYYLSKTLYNLNNVQNLNVFAWCAVSAVKGFQQEGFAHKTDYRERIEAVVKELRALKIEPKTDFDKALLNQIRHYQTVWLASEEHLAEAFETQREKYLASPADLENLRSLGWTLHDCIKQASETLKSRKLVEFFASELRRLDYPEDLKIADPLLAKCHDSDLLKASRFLNGTGEVVALTKSGDLAAALVAAEKLVKEQPENPAAHSALAEIYEKMLRRRDALRECLNAVKFDPENEKNQVGAAWALVKFIRERLVQKAASDESDPRIILHGVSCLERWKRLPKPSLVYSQLLRVYTKLVKGVGKNVPPTLADSYLKFVDKWDLKNLTDEDLKPYVPKDTPQKTFPSLCESVAGAVYRCAVRATGYVRDNPWPIEFLREAVKRFPGQKWFPYYYGKLLVEQGQCDEARKYIVKIAQQKMSEFWVWQILAEIYPESRERQLACLCRAALCKVQDASYLVTVHEMLGELLKGFGFNAEALFEFRVVDAIRSEKGWKAQDRGADYLQWQKGIEAVRDNKKLYRQWAANADALVLEDKPGMDAIVTARYRDRDRDTEVARVWWTDGRRQCEVRVKAAKYPALAKAKPGMPVRVWADRIDGRDAILKLEDRIDGNPWDVYPKRPGVLVAHDERRGHSIVVIGDQGESCLVDWRNEPTIRDVEVGAICELATSRRPTGVVDVRYVRFPETPALPTFAKRYSGELRILEGRSFGFVGTDIFVPDCLADGVPSGSHVHGLAARSYDKSKNRVGWKAVTMEVVT